MEEKEQLIHIINLLMDEINNNGVVLSDATKQYIQWFLDSRKVV